MTYRIPGMPSVAKVAEVERLHGSAAALSFIERAQRAAEQRNRLGIDDNHPLTVGALRQILAEIPDDTVVEATGTEPGLGQLRFYCAPVYNATDKTLTLER